MLRRSAETAWPSPSSPTTSTYPDDRRRTLLIGLSKPSWKTPPTKDRQCVDGSSTPPGDSRDGKMQRSFVSLRGLSLPGIWLQVGQRQASTQAAEYHASRITTNLSRAGGVSITLRSSWTSE